MMLQIVMYFTLYKGGHIMISPKVPNDVKFSTTGVKRSNDFIIHNCGYDTLTGEYKKIGPLLRDYNVIRYCTSGKGTLTLNGKTYNVSEGQCYVILAGDMVTEAVAGEEFSMTYVTFIGIKAFSYLTQIGVTSQHPFMPWTKNDEFLKKLTDIITDIQGHAHDTEFLRCSLAYKLLYCMQTILASSKVEDNGEHLHEQYVDAALRYMESNYTKRINVSDIAAYIGINRSYFYSLFKRRTGLSPQEHLTRLRISKACDLFAYPHSTIVNVANALGLEPSVFFRHFKRITGKTPSEYKQSLKK